ncbi:MAG: hypothetical protein K6G06_01415 [Butyrivibrio sp.]|nr:hypothetical protein [Butyrivibrio sp.]
MRSKFISLMLSTVLAASIVSGCGKAASETSTNSNENQSPAEETEVNSDNADSSTIEADEPSDESTDENTTEGTDESSPASSFDELIASLHPGQAYTYAPICEGEDALLVTSYTFDDLEGHQATYEATIFAEKDGSVQKVTTVQTAGTAYPIALTDDNSLILQNRNSVQKAYVDKRTCEYVITEESNVNYTEAEDGDYHNYKKDESDVPADSSLFDELNDKYLSSEILSFQPAGVSDDGTLNLKGAVYAAYPEDDQYNVTSYIVFDNETSGHTQTPDGISSVPFDYETNGKNITFHFGSADDTTEGAFSDETTSFPIITFAGDNIFGSDKISVACIGNADAASFDAVKYYDNDNTLLMQVKSFDEKSLTGDLYREEKIKADIVEAASIGDSIYSTNGTQFTVVTFEDVNKEIEYDTDETFKADVLGTTRYDGFLVKCSTDDFYYALEKEDYENEYTVVMMLNSGNLKKLIEEDVTFRIKDSCEITLLKFNENSADRNIDSEYLIGREFKGDNYPGWSEDATEYYITDGMLVAVGVIDGELYNFVQIFVP